MSNLKQHIVPAFTIFEVTVVLAIMSVIVSMVAFSVQRLFHQMQVTEEIHTELNNFYQVRSMLWYDCVTADSIIVQDQQFLTYSDGKFVQYRLEEEALYRNQHGADQELGMAIQSLENREAEGGSELVLTFNWKGEPMEWRFFNLPDVSEGVNQFFDKRDG
ncbi:MAG: type II secretion system protein [Fluviicola sp.]